MNYQPPMLENDVPKQADYTQPQYTGQTYGYQPIQSNYDNYFAAQPNHNDEIGQGMSDSQFQEVQSKKVLPNQDYYAPARNNNNEYVPPVGQYHVIPEEKVVVSEGKANHGNNNRIDADPCLDCCCSALCTCLFQTVCQILCTVLCDALCNSICK